MRLMVLIVSLALLMIVVPVDAKPVPPTCSDKPIVNNGVVSAGLNRSCGATVSVDPMDCVWNGSWKTYTVGNNQVRYYSCDGPDRT